MLIFVNYTHYKDYNKDAKDNILQRRDILSDDEFDFLSNSNNDKSNNDKSNDDANDNEDVNTNSMINENNILDIELNLFACGPYIDPYLRMVKSSPYFLEYSSIILV